MTPINDKQLVLSLRILPGVVTLVMLFIIIMILVLESKNRQKSFLAYVDQDHKGRVEQFLEQQVTSIVQQIDYEGSQAEERLKGQLKEGVGYKFDLINRLYKEDKTRTENQVKEKVMSYFSSISFDSADSEYIILDLNEENNMFSSHLFERISKNLIFENEFYHVWNTDNDNKKVMGYFKYFSPYNWLIIKYEPLSNTYNRAQNNLLKWISTIRFDKSRYIFVMDESGTILSHLKPSEIGTKQPELLHQIKEGVVHNKHDAYISYTTKFSNNPIYYTKKISYVQHYMPWGWYIASGVDESEFLDYFSNQGDMINSYNNEQIKNLSILFVLLAFSVFGLSFLACHFLKKRLSNYQLSCSEYLEKINNTNQRLNHLATHDSLTGILNRDRLYTILDESLSITRRKTDKLAVIFVAVNEYEKINDKYGHDVGGKVLRTISHKLESVLDSNQIIARFESSQFVILIPQLLDKKDLDDIIDNITNSFNSRLSIDNLYLKVNCCLGIAIYPEHGLSSKQLILNASTVLYRNRSFNKNQLVSIFDESIRHEIEREYQIEDKLKSALDNNEISIAYQPQLDAKTGNIKGIEALARWKNESLGNVRPDEFIGVAEKSGLISSLGLYIFKTACQEMLLMSKEVPLLQTISINISPVQLNTPNFVADLMTIIKEVGIDTQSIILEITENVFIDDVDYVRPILIELRNKGFGLSLDDFGTGYSSLKYLNHLPITEIKIDKVFICKISLSEQNESLVKNIINIGISNNIQVVAEGVETEEQKNQLTLYGCDLLQGYYYSKPISKTSIIENYQ
ncbi:hypothetical protein BCU68_04600 [Vibrio sp. 10N.286.49.B3]|uniref:bifunctional diguanylate cyclase/phosphodiesterase n=1 Tax=Vibrio sp. 10N.286.49.B3 TaxID=1880855 RepID=UPI000C83B643|nr:EAL domain-containing protein [Vibrio sp. 10N.286.49.B3]PMH43269.1 hypothetical protein BCU68_04600 [Vibrio sp. 10N.286.49.B3]